MLPQKQLNIKAYEKKKRSTKTCAVNKSLKKRIIHNRQDHHRNVAERKFSKEGVLWLLLWATLVDNPNRKFTKTSYGYPNYAEDLILAVRAQFPKVLA